MRRAGAFTRHWLWSIRLLFDTRHFGVGVVIENTPGATQFTIHFGFLLFKIIRYWTRYYVARRLAYAAYMYERMLDELRDETLKWRTGGKKLSKQEIENLDRIFLPVPQKKPKRRGKR